MKASETDAGRQPDSGSKSVKERLAIASLFFFIPFLLHGTISWFAAEPPPPLDSGFPVKIRLSSGSPGEWPSFTVDSPYRVYRGNAFHGYNDPGFIAYGYRLGSGKARVLRDGRITINKSPLGRGTITIVPRDRGAIKINGTRYSGALLIEVQGQNDVVLYNLVDVEEYLAGVLFKEMPGSFHREALKAQTVAARTYALFMMEKGSGVLMADTRSQVYGGETAASNRSRQIVAETAGEVLTYEGEIIQAFFSSTCGGMTIRADDVYPNPSALPVNHNTPCGYCGESPFRSWAITVPASEIIDKFGLGGRCRNPEVGITKTDAARRALELSLQDDRGHVLRKVPADRFRSLINKGRPLSRKMLSTRIDEIVPGREIRIRGSGFGHGIGLCQYGSNGMAKRGYDYRQILAFYYRAAEIRTLAAPRRDMTTVQ